LILLHIFIKWWEGCVRCRRGVQVVWVRDGELNDSR
jgi:hypothetical protein